MFDFAYMILGGKRTKDLFFKTSPLFFFIP